MSANKSLAHFDYRFNDIGIDGATAIAQSVPLCSSLKRVWTYGNKCGDRGRDLLRNAARVHKIDLEC